MNIAFFYIIIYNNYSGDSMNKYEETKQFIDDFAEEHGLNSRPDALTREIARKLRKDKNMSYEEQAQKIIDDYSKKHLLDGNIEDPLEKAYNKSMSDIEIEIHGETYRGKDVTKNKTNDFLRVVIAVVALGVALKGAVDLTLLDEYKVMEKSKISDELTKEEQESYKKLKLKDLKEIRKIEKEKENDYTFLGNRKDGTHSPYASNDVYAAFAATDQGLDAAEEYIDDKIDEFKKK